ncbi:MAG: hypothetical protein NC180_10875 [Muribaculaceae bacterium]|nr:hypothetical protein [Roseburia sp.]MCM1432032.1 hypothetical protein [Muribaculaceae bacterium]MCM1493715.1 hypothetical protein [Muribaculaceae bacterium]
MPGDDDIDIGMLREKKEICISETARDNYDNMLQS